MTKLGDAEEVFYDNPAGDTISQQIHRKTYYLW